MCGLLIIDTTNFDSPTVKLLGQRWSQFFPPAHLFYFSMRTLRTYLEKNGFAIEKAKTEGPFFYDDLTDIYFFGESLFSRRFIQRITNKLNFGYGQLVIARKIKDI